MNPTKLPVRKYILFAKEYEHSDDPKEIMNLYKVNPEECIIMRPRTSLAEYPVDLKVLCWSHAGTWRMEFCPTAGQVIGRLKRGPLTEPHPEGVPQKIGETGGSDRRGDPAGAL